MRLMLCAFGQETNTFSPKRLDFKSFLPEGWQCAETLLDAYRNTKSYLGGAIEACEEAGVEIIPLDSIPIDGGAMMTAECFESCMEHLCGQVKEFWQGADGLFLAMHGAGSAEGVEDLESETMRRIRTIVGKNFSITSEKESLSSL